MLAQYILFSDASRAFFYLLLFYPHASSLAIHSQGLYYQ